MDGEVKFYVVYYIWRSDRNTVVEEIGLEVPKFCSLQFRLCTLSQQTDFSFWAWCCSRHHAHVKMALSLFHKGLKFLTFVNWEVHDELSPFPAFFYLLNSCSFILSIFIYTCIYMFLLQIRSLIFFIVHCTIKIIMYSKIPQLRPPKIKTNSPLKSVFKKFQSFFLCFLH